MNQALVEKVKIIALFILAIAISCGYGKLLGVSAVLGLAVVFFDKDRFYYLKKDVFLKTLYLFGGFIIITLLMELYQGNVDGIRYQVRYFEKIIPYIIIYLFIGKMNVKNALIAAAFGIVVGTLINAGYLTYDYVYHLENYNGRYGGMLGHPNKLGGIIAFIFPFVIYLAYFFKKNQKMFTLMILLTILLATCLFVAQSRGAWISCALELSLGLWYYRYKQDDFQFKIKNLLSGMAIFVTICLGMYFFAERSYDGERLLLWQAAWQMFLDHPILGVGTLRWNEFYIAQYISPLAQEPNLPHPHNLFLLLLSETGIIGLGAYLMMEIGILKLSLQDFWKKNKEIALPEVFAISLLGSTGHSMVDVICTTRDFMLAIFFFWGLSCIYLVENKENKKPVG